MLTIRRAGRHRQDPARAGAGRPADQTAGRAGQRRGPARSVTARAARPLATATTRASCWPRSCRPSGPSLSGRARTWSSCSATSSTAGRSCWCWTTSSSWSPRRARSTCWSTCWSGCRHLSCVLTSRFALHLLRRAPLPLGPLGVPDRGSLRPRPRCGPASRSSCSWNGPGRRRRTSRSPRQRGGRGRAVPDARRPAAGAGAGGRPDPGPATAGHGAAHRPAAAAAHRWRPGPARTGSAACGPRWTAARSCSTRPRPASSPSCRCSSAAGRSAPPRQVCDSAEEVVDVLDPAGRSQPRGRRRLRPARHARDDPRVRRASSCRGRDRGPAGGPPPAHPLFRRLRRRRRQPVPASPDARDPGPARRRVRQPDRRAGPRRRGRRPDQLRPAGRRHAELLVLHRPDRPGGALAGPDRRRPAAGRAARPRARRHRQRRPRQGRPGPGRRAARRGGRGGPRVGRTAAAGPGAVPARAGLPARGPGGSGAGVRR